MALHPPRRAPPPHGSHGGATPDLPALAALTASVDADILVAGGVASLEALGQLRDAGVAGT